MVSSTTPTPVTQWKGRIEVEGSDLQLPSENVARVKQISPQAFITSGLLPDPLSNIVRKAINSKQGLKPADMKKVSDDPEMLGAALELFDRVLAFVMVEPRVSMPPTCECGVYYNVDARHKDQSLPNYHEYNEQPRDPQVLYADQVAMDDKVFIFNWCLGGTRDLEKFRSEQQAVVESVSDGEDVQVPAKRSSRRR